MIEWDQDLFFRPRWGFAWYPAYDKLGHFVCHYFAAHLTDAWFQSLDKVLIVAIWFFIGVLYEFFWDVPRGRKASWKDMIANLVGDVLGVLV